MKFYDNQFNSLKIENLNSSLVHSVCTTNSFSENPATITKSINFVKHLVETNCGDVVNAYIEKGSFRVQSLETNREVILYTDQDLTELF